MLMAMSMKENGKMIKLMEKESITIQMELVMKVTGMRTNSMVRELKHGQMMLNIQGVTKMERRMDMVNLCGQMDLPTKGSSLITIYTVKEYIHGQISENSTVSGLIIKCMDKEFSRGLMVECTKESIRMIRNKDLVYLLGQMEGNTKGNGTTVNNIVK